MKIPAKITQEWLRKRTNKQLIALAKKFSLRTAQGLMIREHLVHQSGELLLQERDSKPEPIHYLDCTTFAAVWTACGEGMQSGHNKWHKDVNLWGNEGIRKTNGFVLGTTDMGHVTCPKCFQQLRRRKKSEVDA